MKPPPNSVDDEAVRRNQRQELLTEQLNRIYAEPPSPDEKAVLVQMKTMFRATIQDRW